MMMERYFDKGKIKSCIIYTTVFMLVAYMYAYTNGTFLYDASRIYRGEEPFVVTSDKWFGIFLGRMDAHMNLPWLAGILSILFMAIAVFCIVDIMQIKSRTGMILTAGLCCTQSSIIIQQEYIGGNYIGEFALLFACLSVWGVLKIENVWLRTIISISCIAISAGTYGAYIGMVPCLMMILLIMDIMKGKSAKDNWKTAVGYAILFLLGMILYYVILRCGVIMTHSQIQSYMGEDKLASISGVWESVYFIPEAYYRIFRYYLGKANYLPPVLNQLMVIILILGILLSVVLFVKNKNVIKDKTTNILLLIIIIALLPMAINLICVLSSGREHYLMIFPYIIPFLITGKAIDVCLGKRIGVEYRLTIINTIFLSVFIYYSVVLANAVMVHLNHMFVETQSICTSMVNRIESCEGFDGTEEVVLIGALQHNDYFHVTKETDAKILDAYLRPGGMQTVNGVSSGRLVVDYISNIQNNSLVYNVYVSTEEFLEENADLDSFLIDMIKEMPAYPCDGSVQKINDVIYIYLGEEK